MRLPGQLEHPTLHSALSNVLADQHHRAPSGLSVVNTTLSISPLPGGPGQWDVSVPEDTVAVLFNFRSAHASDDGLAKSGVTGIATQNQFQAATASLGGHGDASTTGYSACYSKAASSMYLSHKIFSSGGLYIALTDIYLTLTAPSTRVLRSTWTNFGAAYYTLSVYGELLLWH